MTEQKRLLGVEAEVEQSVARSEALQSNGTVIAEAAEIQKINF
jgi:hypothetical protein